MTLLEQLHAAHKERLARINARSINKPIERVEPEIVPEISVTNDRSFWFVIEDSSPPSDLFVQDIISVVCKYFGITSVVLRGERRTANIVYPRQVAMYLARQYTTRSLPEIGRRMGGRDHTTVLHGARMIEKRIRSDWRVAYDVAHLEAML